MLLSDTPVTTKRPPLLEEEEEERGTRSAVGTGKVRDSRGPEQPGSPQYLNVQNLRWKRHRQGKGGSGRWTVKEGGLTEIDGGSLACGWAAGRSRSASGGVSYS